MTSDLDIERMHTIDREFQSVILEFFPNISFDGWGNSANDFHAHLSEKNSSFKDTDYFYQGESEFFHLTSIKNIFSILNHRSIRMYNQHNSDDADEYAFSAKLLNLKSEEIDRSKNDLYTFSFCPITEINNENVWKTYGHNYGGAAIVFTIENDLEGWNNFHLSEVKYKLNPAFANYFEKLKQFESKYSITAYCDLSKLIAFYKQEKWQNEKEVRLMTYRPFDSYAERLKYLKTDFKEISKRIVNYYELPLWVDNEKVKSNSGNRSLDRTQILPSSNFFITAPKIKIKNIIIGRNAGLGLIEYQKFRWELIKTIRNNCGYFIEMDQNLFGPRDMESG